MKGSSSCRRSTNVVLAAYYYCCFMMMMMMMSGVSYGFTTTPYQKISLMKEMMTSTRLSETLDGEEIPGPITPLGNFVLVRTKDALSATSGGILLPDQSKERPTEGEVMAAGPGKLHPYTGVRIDNPVSPGYSVLYGKFTGTDMMYNDEAMKMIRDDDIMLYYQGVQMTRKNVIPCRDYVLVELPKSSKMETKSGIVVASAVTKDELPCEGIVFQVGEGRMCSTGDFTPSPVSIGDQVKFKEYSGNDVKIEGSEFSIVRMVDILCSIPQVVQEEVSA